MATLAATGFSFAVFGVKPLQPWRWPVTDETSGCKRSTQEKPLIPKVQNGRFQAKIRPGSDAELFMSYLIHWIKYMKSSASESIRNACFNSERLSRSFRSVWPKWAFFAFDLVQLQIRSASESIQPVLIIWGSWSALIRIRFGSWKVWCLNRA